MVGQGVGEGGDDVGGECSAAGVGGDVVPGVIIEDVQDLQVGGVGELPVRGFGLPAFVGLLGGEPD